MMAKPIITGFINFNKCSLLENRILIGIDYGSSLLKFVFLNKKFKDQLNDENSKCITLQHATFNNEDFDLALEFLKENAYIPEKSEFRIHGTGTRFMQNKTKIESVFGLAVENVHEGIAMVAGHRLALEHCPIECLIHPPVNPHEIIELKNELMEKMMSGMMKKLNTNECRNNKDSSSLYPYLLGYWGSGSVMFLYNEDGLAQQIGPFHNGGKSFLGLAKCLMDINNYDEIILNASKGDRKNVDTLVKDILTNDIKSPYGKFPPELPIFSFGKCADSNLGTEYYTKEDLAMSLICLECSKLFSICREICMITKVKKIYFSGNLFQSNLFHREIMNRNKRYNIGLELSFLNLGFGAALGAMLCCNEDKDLYMK